MSDVGYSGVANLAPTTLGYAKDVQGSNYRQLAGVGDGGVTMSPDYIPSALTLLNRLTTSPAGIFVSGQGYLQTPGNLALRSSAVNDAAWTKSGTCTTPSANTIGLPTDGDFLNNTTGYVTVVSSPYTMAVLLSGTGTVRIGSNSAGVTSTLVTLTPTPTLYAHNFSAGSVTSYILPAYRSGTSATLVTCDAIGFFQGTYTASQLAAMGGVPLTTSAAVAATYTDAHVYSAGSTQTVYGAELNNAPLSAWTYGTWTYNAGGYVDSSAGSGFAAIPSAAPVVGKVYTFTFTSANTVTLNLVAGNTYTNVTPVVGINTFDAPCNAAGSLLGFQGGASTNQIRNISVREKITQSSVINSFNTGNYTLSDGSTGFSAVDGSAGLVLDGMGTVGSELVSNPGPFTATTGWVSANSAVLGVSAGSLTLAGNGVTAFPGAYFNMTTVIGNTYKVVVTLTVASGTGAIVVKALPNAGGANVASTTTTAAGEYTLIFTATGTAHSVGLEGAPNTFTASFSSFSFKQVTGIHATQATAGNRPAVRRGALNLLTYSQDFSNAAWVVGATATKAFACMTPFGMTICPICHFLMIGPYSHPKTKLATG
jgi:hypothetical protein